MPAAREIVNPIIGEKVFFQKPSRETDKKKPPIEGGLAVTGGTGLPYPRRFAESFTAVEGQLSLEADGEIIRLQPGESATVQPMTVHRFFNETNQRIRFMVSLKPGSEGFEKVLQIAYGMACDGLVRPSGAPKSLQHLALIATIGETNLPGIFKLMEPLFGWMAKRAINAGVLAELEARYCRL